LCKLQRILFWGPKVQACGGHKPPRAGPEYDKTCLQSADRHCSIVELKLLTAKRKVMSWPDNRIAYYWK